MAKLNKQQYEYRREAAFSRMQENKENCSSLTEEQHDALTQICTIRHEIHSNIDSAFNVESTIYSKIIEWLDGESNYSINMLLKNAGLDNILFWNCDLEKVPNSYDYIDMGYDYEEALDEHYSLFSRINNEIEDFLRKIDQTHKTSYAPTGTHRILN